MKYLAAIGVVLAASQCPLSDTAETKEEKAEDESASVEDAGSETPDAGPAESFDVGADGMMVRGIWLEPGPEPFGVPTRRVELAGLDATMVAPAGTDVFKTPGGVDAKLGEGKNFWIEVVEGATDLSDASALVASETGEVVRDFQDAVVWNRGERWYFKFSGAFSCSNPVGARHDYDDVELMIAACRTIEPAGVDADDESDYDE